MRIAPGMLPAAVAGWILASSLPHLFRARTRAKQNGIFAFLLWLIAFVLFEMIAPAAGRH